MPQDIPILPMVVAAGAGIAAIALWTQYGGSPTSSTSPWQGPPEQRDTQRMPSFSTDAAGRQAFVAYMVPLLQAHGLSQASALLFTAHLARETGYGQGVYNYNFGNIKAGSNPQHPYFILTDRLGFTDPYRAYDSADAGIEDDLRLIRDSSRYQDAWGMLLAGDSNWYGQLGLDGYYEGPPDPNHPGVHTNNTTETIVPVQNEYNSILASVQQDYAQAGGSTPSTSTDVFVAIAVAGVVGGVAWYIIARHDAKPSRK